MATVKILDNKGKEKGSVEIKAAPEASRSILHRAVVAEESNSRQGTQKAKTRAEVRGGGRKPYKQKKTGRARQGTVSAPHYAHGGVAFAPVPRDYSKKVNKKERRLALRTALAVKADDGSVVVVDKIEFSAIKTKDAIAFLKTVAPDARRVLVILPTYDEVVLKSFRNIPMVSVRTAPVRVKGKDEVKAKSQSFSTRDLLVANKIVIAKDALSAIEEAWA